MKTPKNIENMKGQWGLAAVEFAIILSLFLGPLLVGVINYGQYMNIRHTLSRAALQAGLAASRDEDVNAVVSSYLVAAGINPSTVSVSVSSASGTSDLGDLMTATITYTSNDKLMQGFESFIPGISTMTVSATLRHQ